MPSSKRGPPASPISRASATTEGATRHARQGHQLRHRLLPGGKDSRPGFDPETARRELRIIAEDLHCTAVRISGGDPERLSIAARHAAEAGLEVWFSPTPCELDRQQLLPYFADCANRAEQIRAEGAPVVLVLGCELTLLCQGFIPGDTSYERIKALSTGGPRVWMKLGKIGKQLSTLLAETAADARTRFGGKISYASGTWEQVDWKPFDFVGVDAYRDANNAGAFAKQLRRHFKHGKPVAVTEFGCCTYTGAADRGGMGWAIVDHTTEPPHLTGQYQRSETEQVSYLNDLLGIFEHEGVDSAFWFTFVNEQAVHRPGEALTDLDVASYAVVKKLPSGISGTTYPELGWEPKEAFHALAASYDHRIQ
ncbi:hypothetical protein KDL01_31280 [Actinospica durhamensis]|uniref:Abortive infection protein n=1 Tax=Actinospica durhamensis TaxID=1508375 RepID=A0A941F080_9ACTN|nr:hypothetical protein [Actinospica durhamensis]MBR7837799.1 hypothetical protein [Actinospica durhamensis]